MEHSNSFELEKAMSKNDNTDGPSHHTQALRSQSTTLVAKPTPTITKLSSYDASNDTQSISQEKKRLTIFGAERVKLSTTLKNKPNKTIPFVILEPRELKGGKSFGNAALSKLKNNSPKFNQNHKNTKLITPRNNFQSYVQSSNDPRVCSKFQPNKGNQKIDYNTKVEQRRALHSHRRVQESKTRFTNAFTEALKINNEFKNKYKSVQNCLQKYGEAARDLGINWFEGTKDKPVDAIYIIGESDLLRVSNREYVEDGINTPIGRNDKRYLKGDKKNTIRPTSIRINKNPIYNFPITLPSKNLEFYNEDMYSQMVFFSDDSYQSQH